MSEKVTQIIIGDHRIGIIGLYDVIKDIKELKLVNDREIQTLLLAGIKHQNWILDSKTKEYGNALLREYKKSLGSAVEEEKLREATIHVLGPGCSACEKMEQDVKSILIELNIAADVQHIRDVNQIAEYGMVRTPTLVINNEIVINGRSLPKSQLKSLIERKLR